MSTQAEIAAACGVSKGAVSLALSRGPENCPLREETRQRIIREAKRVGYRPNWRGRMLANNRTQCVAFLYNRVTPFSQDMRNASMIAEALQSCRHDMMLTPALGPCEDWSARLLDGRIDGAFAIAPSPLGLDEFSANSGLPLVLLNLDSELDLPQILFEEYAGTRSATRHLLEHGHRRIVFYLPPGIGDLDHYSYRDRLRGYRDQMREAGLGEGQVWELARPEWCRRLLETDPAERPTAVVGYAQHTTMSLMHELADRGVMCPRDLSFVTFNDDANGDRMIPALTSVALPWDRLSGLAVDYLMRLLAKSDETPPRVTELPVELISRQSVVPPDGG